MPRVGDGERPKVDAGRVPIESRRRRVSAPDAAMVRSTVSTAEASDHSTGTYVHQLHFVGPTDGGVEPTRSAVAGATDASVGRFAPAIRDEQDAAVTQAADMTVSTPRRGPSATTAPPTHGAPGGRTADVAGWAGGADGPSPF